MGLIQSGGTWLSRAFLPLINETNKGEELIECQLLESDKRIEIKKLTICCMSYCIMS